MAGITVEPLMPPVQLELRPCVVVKVPELPTSQTVTILALRTQPAPMHVVVLMASVAGRGCLVLIEATGMATLTVCCAMLAQKWVFCVSIVIESDCFPFVLVVAFLALCSKVRSMNIVFLMARMAFGRCLVFVECACMATVAFRLSVIALEEVRSIPIMLKEQYLPVPFGVAALALLTETPLMLVVMLVAGVAINRSLILI